MRIQRLAIPAEVIASEHHQLVTFECLTSRIVCENDCVIAHQLFTDNSEIGRIGLGTHCYLVNVLLHRLLVTGPFEGGCLPQHINVNDPAAMINVPQVKMHLLCYVAPDRIAMNLCPACNAWFYGDPLMVAFNAVSKIVVPLWLFGSWPYKIEVAHQYVDELGHFVNA